MAEQGAPGVGGHADIAAFPTGVLEQVVRHGVPGDLAHAGAGRGERRGGTVQLLGGVGQGLLEPVLRRLGLLDAGAVARRRGAQQPGRQRSAGTQPGRIQRRGQHRPRVRVAGLGVLPPGDQLRRGGQRLGQAVPGRLQRDPHPPITFGGCVGPPLLCFAELRADTDHVGQIQHLAFPRMRVGAAGFRQGSVGGIPVWPQRADDHHRVPGLQQRPHHATGQPVLAIQITLQLIQPHHQPRRRRLRQRGDLVRPGRMHQLPVRQRVSDRFKCGPGLADRGPADQQHEPAPLGGGGHLGSDPGLGGIGITRHVLRRDLVRHSGHADRRVHAQPPRIGLADPYRPSRTS